MQMMPHISIVAIVSAKGSELSSVYTWGGGGGGGIIRKLLKMFTFFR
jgi:hypothetical protein